MDQLLKQEKILFDSVMNKETDGDTISAFHDYATFLSDAGAPLLTHLFIQLKEYQAEIAEYEQLYTDIFEKIKTDTQKLKKLVKKLKLEADPVLMDRFNDLQTFIDGDYFASKLGYFDGPQMEFMDILRKLDDLGFHDEIQPYAIMSSDYKPFVKDAVTFEDRKKYYSLLKAFDKKHRQSVIGALARIMGTLADLNNPESESSYSRSSLVAHVDKVHNSIVLNNPELTGKIDVNDRIFWIEGDDIYHYQQGILTYKKRGTREPKYISMFKNIIRYMPANSSAITISAFEKLVPKDKQVGLGYRNTLMKDGVFNKFLGNNNIKTTHPKTGQEVLRATDKFIYFYNNL